MFCAIEGRPSHNILIYINNLTLESESDCVGHLSKYFSVIFLFLLVLIINTIVYGTSFCLALFTRILSSSFIDISTSTFIYSEVVIYSILFKRLFPPPFVI